MFLHIEHYVGEVHFKKKTFKTYKDNRVLDVSIALVPSAKCQWDFSTGFYNFKHKKAQSTPNKLHHICMFA